MKTSTLRNPKCWEVGHCSTHSFPAPTYNAAPEEVQGRNHAGTCKVGHRVDLSIGIRRSVCLEAAAPEMGEYKTNMGWAKRAKGFVSPEVDGWECVGAEVHSWGIPMTVMETSVLGDVGSPLRSSPEKGVALIKKRGHLLRRL